MTTSERRVEARVSRETFERLRIFADELARWQKALNLVSARSLSDIWNRHIDDSVQIAELASSAITWADLGSGGGLPGLVIAAVRLDCHVTLVESDDRKCAFLRATARRMGVSVNVFNGRIDAVDPACVSGIQVVSARALAPLDALLAYAQPFLSNGALGLFPKGRGVDAELTKARESWIFTVERVPSRTDPDGCILCIRDFAGPAP